MFVKSTQIDYAQNRNNGATQSQDDSVPLAVYLTPSQIEMQQKMGKFPLRAICLESQRQDFADGIRANHSSHDSHQGRRIRQRRSRGRGHGATAHKDSLEDELPTLLNDESSLDSRERIRRHLRLRRKSQRQKNSKQENQRRRARRDRNSAPQLLGDE